MTRDDIVAERGLGSVPRILDTLNCFRRRYGSWPTRLLLDKDMAEAIQEHHLTPAGWKALASKIDIRYSVVGTVIAEDSNGNSYEYDSTFDTPEGKDNSADYWIWGCQVWPE